MNQGMVLAGVRGNVVQAIESVHEFLKQFTSKRELARIGHVRLDDYYSGSFRFSKLEEDENPVLGTYLYDEEKWCRGCNNNCQYRSKELTFYELYESTALKAARSLSEIAELSKHTLTKNLYMGLSIGSRDLWIVAYQNNCDTRIKRLGKISVNVSSIESKHIAYRKALELVDTVRRL